MEGLGHLAPRQHDSRRILRDRPSPSPLPLPCCSRWLPRKLAPLRDVLHVRRCRREQNVEQRERREERHQEEVHEAAGPRQSLQRRHRTWSGQGGISYF